MKQRPILMSGPLVREILAGNKTQTRRPIKALKEMNPESINLLSNEMWEETFEFDRKKNGHVFHILSKYGVPGDQLWVRETWHPKRHNMPTGFHYEYRATAEEDGNPTDEPWKPSIFMPKAASRITLEIEEIRVERLGDISEDDAKAEGVEPFEVTDEFKRSWDSYRLGFNLKWTEIYGIESYNSNPWVWVINFKVL